MGAPGRRRGLVVGGDQHAVSTHAADGQIPFPTKATAEVNQGKTIPRTVHQVEINPEGKDIPLWRMLAGMAILAQIKPDKLLFHYPAGGIGPNGEYWERLVSKRWATAEQSLRSSGGQSLIAYVVAPRAPRPASQTRRVLLRLWRVETSLRLSPEQKPSVARKSHPMSTFRSCTWCGRDNTLYTKNNRFLVRRTCCSTIRPGSCVCVVQEELASSKLAWPRAEESFELQLRVLALQHLPRGLPACHARRRASANTEPTPYQCHVTARHASIKSVPHPMPPNSTVLPPVHNHTALQLEWLRRVVAGILRQLLLIYLFNLFILLIFVGSCLDYVQLRSRPPGLSRLGGSHTRANRIPLGASYRVEQRAANAAARPTSASGAKTVTF
jgi:hypothetical protein